MANSYTCHLSTEPVYEGRLEDMERIFQDVDLQASFGTLEDAVPCASKDTEGNGI